MPCDIARAASRRYGDAYPVTDGGYAIATACMMVGIIIMALPITVLGTTFTSLLEERTRIDALYKLADTTLDGKVGPRPRQRRSGPRRAPSIVGGRHARARA